MAFSLYWYINRIAFENPTHDLDKTILHIRCAELEALRTSLPEPAVFGWVKPRGNSSMVQQVVQEMATHADILEEISADKFPDDADFKLFKQLIEERNLTSLWKDMTG